jgi:hypothetical protein
MDELLGMWDESAKELTILRPSGQKYRVHSTPILAGSHKVFGVETVGKEIHVLTGPRGNRQPSRRVKFNDSGMYKGNSGL